MTSNDDLAARLSRHQPYWDTADRTGERFQMCSCGSELDDCDAAVLGTALERETLERQGLENRLLAADGDKLRADYALAQERQARQAAEAEATRLRDLLERIEHQLHFNLACYEHAEHSDMIPWDEVLDYLREVVSLPIKMTETRRALAEK